MDKQSISTALETKWAARELEFYPVIDSTNNIATEAGKSGKASGFLAVADRQDAGRGRRGRSWVSPPDYNVFMSIMIRPDISIDKAPGLTLVMALSILKGIEDMLPQEEKESLGIKWPNDIVLSKKKICGILTELFPTGNQNEFFVVIGVGINVNQPADLFPEDIKDMAGSVLSVTGKKISRSELISGCMKRFEDYYEAYVREGNLSTLRAEYEDKLLNIGKPVRVLDPKGDYEALSKGITDDGALIVELPDGEMRQINAGEVSVRGLYGYT